MKIRFYIDDSYRRAPFLEGHELNNDYEVELNIATLTHEERQFLLDAFGKALGKDVEGIAISSDFRLNCPYYREADHQLLYDADWAADVNPTTMPAEEIFSRWKEMYTAAHQEALQEYSKH